MIFFAVVFGMGLESKMDALAKFIQSNSCKSIVFLTGAGVSRAAGIPDFRSPGGMYSTLKPDLLTATETQRRLMKSDPTHVVERSLFMSNPLPYHEVRRPFIIGTYEKKWKATIAHRFIELTHKAGKLRRLYTQNIDGLDFQCTGIPNDMICAVHGSIGKAACEHCGKEMELSAYVRLVREQIKDIYGIDASAPANSSPICCPSCGRPAVKAATVLFGGSMPEAFFRLKRADLVDPDLLIVAGTSLAVFPASAIALDAPPATRRALINRDPAGGVGDDPAAWDTDGGRDLFLQGDVEAVALELIARLGWLDGLAAARDELPPASQEMLDARLARRGSEKAL
jgi:NAD+-dependent protein deacetylase sirtuin 2